MIDSPVAKRPPLRGTWQILQYNWPFYAFGLVAIALGWAALLLLPLPWVLRVLGAAGLGLAGYWLVASLIVSWWVYDASPLYRWTWLLPILSDRPRRWANIHCGLDESSPALVRLIGGEGMMLDIYDDKVMGEGSIRRARAEVARRPGGQLPAQSADFRHLPLADGGLDAAFLFFAAHEIRDALGREQFFAELKRVVCPGGSVIIAEHLRDVANFAAFGPGVWHFLPRSEWLRLAKYAGFAIKTETRLTPFVHIFHLHSEDTSSSRNPVT